MLLPSLTIKDLPLPPSVNKMYATNWHTKRRFTSKDYDIYKRMVEHWKKLWPNQLANAREFCSKITDGQAFRVDMTLYFQRGEVLTKRNTIKRNDTSNRIKAAHDTLSEMLGVDDSSFWDGSFEKKIVAGEHPGWCDITISIFDIEGY